MDRRTTSSRGLRVVVFWLVVCIAVVLDQSTKAAVRVCVPEGGFTLVPGVLDVRLIRNTGAAFSIGEGAGVLFVIIAAVVVAACAFLVWHEGELPLFLVVSIGCVAGGGVGNMLDRIIDGAVTDFLATTFMDFPVFNVADIFVTVGVAATLIGYFVWERRRTTKEAAPVRKGEVDA